MTIAIVYGIHVSIERANAVIPRVARACGEGPAKLEERSNSHTKIPMPQQIYM